MYDILFLLFIYYLWCGVLGEVLVSQPNSCWEERSTASLFQYLIILWYFYGVFQQ